MPATGRPQRHLQPRRILAEMLTGTNPFRASSYPQTVLNHVQMPLPQLPPALAPYQPLLDRMLAKQPDERFASCRELLAAIDTLTEPDMDQTRIAPAITLEAAQPPSPASRARPRPLGGDRRRHGGHGGRPGVRRLPVVAVQPYQRPARPRRVAAGRRSADHAALDNADFYFRQALRLDADNAEALDGLRRVLDARIAEALSWRRSGWPAISCWSRPKTAPCITTSACWAGCRTTRPRWTGWRASANAMSSLPKRPMTGASTPWHWNTSSRVWRPRRNTRRCSRCTTPMRDGSPRPAHRVR